MSKTNIEQQSLSIKIGNQKRKLIYRAPTKAQFILQELVSQIPLFWNYEKFILTHLKIKRNEKIILKIKKNYEGACLKEKGNKFIKNGIFDDPEP